MAEFEQLRDALSRHRRELSQQRQEALLAREAVSRAERALAEYARTEDPQTKGEQAQLEAALRAARARADRAGAALSELNIVEAKLMEEFTVFADPRDGLPHCSDMYPILLFPLRLETRFKSSDAGQPQLWVRIYPDTCLVDAFEESLTEQEVANARTFWAAIWRAGGDMSLERAAWRELVASHGSGRAGWIIRRYQPINPNEKPIKDAPTDVLLIVTAAGPLPAVAATYWQAVWRANQDAAAQAAAYAALETAIGTSQAREIAERYRPFNLTDVPAAPRTRAEVQVKVAVLQLTPIENMDTRRRAWSSAPRIDLLPERFVLVGYGQSSDPVVALGSPVRTPLMAGPDPNAPPEQQLKPVEDTLEIPDELAWMFDFERAIAAGMALRVDLTAEQAANGFERLIVLGVRLADTPEDGRQNLERLLDHHLHSRTGLQILPQGTPTNNTEKSGSGYSFHDDADATFDIFFLQTPQYTLVGDPLVRRDGEWLADLLGLPHDLVQRIPNASGRDQIEARAMQIALWPGTLGYMMTTLLAPIFSEDQIATTRKFFTRYVTGRGPLPALRVGAQPYGILPTTAFDRINWFVRDERASSYHGRLYAILKRIDDDWKPLVQYVPYIGKQGGDPHQNLLDVLGLHPSSVEYYPLQAESVEHKFYELAFLDYSIALGLLNLFPAIIPLTLLRSFGYHGEEVPDLLNQIYKARQTPLDGPLIDDRPLSESEGIRNYAHNRNYIEWLIEAAQVGIEQIQQELGFDENKKPTALLYLLLRHALQLSFHATSVRLHAADGEVENTAALMREPTFVHVREMQATSESRYDALFRPAEHITKQPDLLLGDYIAGNLRTIDPDLREQIEALERLSRVPTARLERVFAEHIDTVSYRLDAWKTGLLAFQLEDLRARASRQEAAGLFLGAYGWLESLRPENKVLTPAELPEDLASEINRRDKAPLMRDSTNEGLIHAPSLNHATTAAVLRNGYVANGGQLVVDLSSRRVRLALDILEGMRSGQSLGALLGYRFERHVHDNGPLQVDDLIYHLRRAFPLAANKIQKTKTDEGEARESIAAMNVVDGRKLLEQAEGTHEFTYPFGVAALPRRAADQEAAITSALAHIRDVNDAVADLVLAEGIHQAVLGNYDRSAGTLDAFAKGGYPPEADVIRTPRSGIALTLRTAIHLSPVPPANPLPAIALTPLALAEPALNAWLKDRLPAPNDVGCLVSFTDRTTNAERTEFISQANLGLHPIDLVYRAEVGTDQALNDVDDRILRYLHVNLAPRHDREINIRYTERVAGKVTWFELQALVRSLRALAVASRPLQPADLMRHNDVARQDQAAAALPKSRVQIARDDLHNVHLPGLNALSATLANPAIAIDTALEEFAATVAGLAAYRLPQTGIGFVYEWRAGAYSALVQKVAERVQTWDNRLARYTKRIENYDLHLPPGTSERERIALLQAAEILISTSLITPALPNSHDYRLALDPKQVAFVGKRHALRGLVEIARPTLAQLLADAENQLPLVDFDPEPLDFAEDGGEITRFRSGLIDTVARLKDDVTKRIARVDALLAQHDAGSLTDRVALLQEAAKLLFGEDFQLVPQITLPAAAAVELSNAWQHSASGDLTRHLTDPAGANRDFPVDDWLHGVARVRDKLHHWENVVLLGEALGASGSAELMPLQLPHGPDEPWLALEIPDDYKLLSDRLLYTAHFAEPFDRAKAVCGLLVDEWTEVIPGTEETTGIAFHFDRPNAEPPQVWLLALPAVLDGAWSWDELLAAVNDTLDAAKRRAIEPVHVDNTAYSWFLPATVSAYTFPEISISNNLLRNLHIYAKLAKG